MNAFFITFVINYFAREDKAAREEANKQKVSGLEKGSMNLSNEEIDDLMKNIQKDASNSEIEVKRSSTHTDNKYSEEALEQIDSSKLQRSKSIIKFS